MMPDAGKAETSHERLKDKAWFRRMLTVGPVIVHLKSNYPMRRNYLEGFDGNMNTTIMLDLN